MGTRAEFILGCGGHLPTGVPESDAVTDLHLVEYYDLGETRHEHPACWVFDHHQIVAVLLALYERRATLPARWG